MRQLQSIASVSGRWLVALTIVLGMLTGMSAQAAPLVQPLNNPGECVVTSTADSGDGTLRQCLLVAQAGDIIIFDPFGFPPGTPVTIALASGLPSMSVGNVTIDASNANVILDGGGIGTTPETVLLDDVSLRLDGGSNLVTNGDFSAGLGHWRPWDDRPVATRSLNTSEYRSEPNAYQWASIAHAGFSRTVYDTTDTSAPFDDEPYEEDSTVWIPVTGGGTAELRFWYRYGELNVKLSALFPDGHNEKIGSWWFDWQDDWTEAVVTQTLPAEAIAIAIELRHDHSQRGTPGLRLISDDNTIQGLQVLNFPWDGIVLEDGAQNNTIGGDRTTGAGPLGQGNLISDNVGNGVFISGSETMGNTVSGNNVGTNVGGTSALGNEDYGVEISGGAQFNVIGGDTAGKRNLISGNRTGVNIEHTGTANNTVSGNYIGTNIDGTTAIGNRGHGVRIGRGAGYNVIGGDTPGQRNLISANDASGVRFWLSGTSNTISGNYIGTDISGTRSLGNGDNGITVHAISQTIRGNLISGNGAHGVAIMNSDSTNNTVSGNYIGTNAAGTEVIGNTWHGVFIGYGARDNFVGGDVPGERNLISGNGNSGVAIVHSGTANNTVSGNYIGTDVTGTLALGNEKGVGVGYGAQDNRVTGNLISGNHVGVGIGGDTGTVNNVVSGNYIGTDVSGTTSLSNTAMGVRIEDGAQSNLIGGDNATPGGACTGECNLISGNGSGIWIEGSSTNYNTVSGNYVGTDASGTEPVGNQWIGITIRAGQYNLIGGDTPTSRNLISANVFGVGAYNPTTDHNVIKGNYIGTDAGGTADLGNRGYGIMFCLGAHDNLAEENLVAFSKYYDEYRPGPGILVLNADSVNNTLSQNSIHSNEHKGILLSEGGNTELPVPVITTVDLNAGLVGGTACVLCTVEVFSDAEDEGRWYEGSTAAGVDGAWSLTIGGPFTDPNVTATATDGDGNTSEFSLYTVPNRPPTVGPISAPLDPVPVNTETTVSAVFTDPDGLDTHTALWDWGDGITSPGVVEEGNGSVSVTGSHTYDTPGVYTVKLTVMDSAGNSGESLFEYVVVYDAAGRFVTGGGWIDSPEGAYAPDPSLTGKATFGFVSKYKKGADAPAGQTQFQFHVASLNFHSSSYQWLVIAGPKAQFKGEGTINGAGNYGFMLSAVDAALTPSTDVALFRIKIWDKATDNLVYDNQVACEAVSDDAEPCTTIGGGSIVIHKGKQ